MELHNHRPVTDSARRLDSALGGTGQTPASRASAMRAAIERITRARAAQQEQVQEMTERTRARAARLSDSLELSAAGLRITERDDDASRAARVDTLRTAYENGTLNTRERVERAARALLGGE